MTKPPDYKSHPLWNDAMALTRHVYAFAEHTREHSPQASKRLRRVAVSVPAHVASALSSDRDGRTEHMLAARAALAELSRLAVGAGADGCERLARRVAELDRSVLFEFGAAEAIS